MRLCWKSLAAMAAAVGFAGIVQHVADACGRPPVPAGCMLPPSGDELYATNRQRLDFVPDPNPVNARLLGRRGYAALGNDVWGYVDKDGSEYAIMGLRNGFSIVDINEAPDLREVSWYSGTQSIWRDMATFRNCLYVVADQGSEGLRVIDLSGLPDSTVQVTQDTTDFFRAHTMFLDTTTGYLFINGSNVASGGLLVYDLNKDPANPELVGTWPMTYVHDCYADGTTVWAFLGGVGVAVIDISNPANPTTLKTFSYESIGYSHSGWVTPDRNHMLLCDELDEMSGFHPKTAVRIFERDQRTNDYNLLSTWFHDRKVIDHNIYIKGDYAYLAHYADGLTVIDISDKANPRTHARYDTLPGSTALDFVGSWAAYPFFPSGKIAIGDIDVGLVVVEVEFPAATREGWDVH